MLILEIASLFVNGEHELLSADEPKLGFVNLQTLVQIVFDL